MESQTDPRLVQAKRLIAENKGHEANALLAIIIDIEPDNTDALFLLVDLVKKSKEKQALDWREWLETSPDFLI